MFGEYSYHDKGAREIMDLDAIASELKTMSAEDILKTLQEVKDNHRDSSLCLSGIMGCLDDWQDPRTDILFESDLFQENY